MSSVQPVALVLAGLGGLALLWVALTFNRFVRLRQHMRESWAELWPPHLVTQLEFTDRAGGSA